MSRHQFFALTNIGYCWCGWSQDSADWDGDDHLSRMEAAFRDHLDPVPERKLLDNYWYRNARALCHSTMDEHRCQRDAGHSGEHVDSTHGGAHWSNTDTKAHDTTMPTCYSVGPYGYRCQDAAGHDGQHSDGNTVWEPNTS